MGIGVFIIGFFLGWWQEHVYRSTIAANVNTPDQYAAGWELVR